MLDQQTRRWLSALRPGDWVGIGMYKSWPVLSATDESLTISRESVRCPPATYTNHQFLRKTMQDTDLQNRTYPRPVPPLGPSASPAPAPPPQRQPVRLPSVLPRNHDPLTACVYRLYDADDVLIYVGSAYDPLSRFRVHKSKPWWDRVARYTLQWYPNRALADLAEYTAIVHESPELNLAGRSPSRPYVRTRNRA